MSATTVRLTTAQKRQLERAVKVLERRLGRTLTRGETVDAMSRILVRSPEFTEATSDALDLDLSDDPFFNGSLRFSMGKTDARTIDRVLYGGD